MYCVYLSTSTNQLRLTLSTLHAEMCCWKHTISTVGAIHVESWYHEELRHVGLTPIALCELMSREQVRPKLFCRGEMYFAVDENDFAVVENDFAVMKLILPYCELDFTVLK